MELTIIMPSFKRPELLKHGLECIKNQSISVDYEVLVLNDGIKDDTEAICKEYEKSANVRYIFTGQRNNTELIYRCPSFALNIGIKQGTGKFVLLTSPEIHYLSSGCINNMISLATIHPNDLVIPEFGWDDQKGITTQRILAGDQIKNMQLEPLMELNVEFPFCLMLKRQVLLDIGGYDEDFTGYCYDDADIISRLHQNNNGTYHRAQGHNIIHLFHGVRSRRDGLTDRNGKLNYNRKLFNERKTQARRNVNREWGVLQMKERENIFTKTYEENGFKGRASKSGTGSDLENVQDLIPRLAEFFNANNIKSLVDAPCGDFNWMPNVLKMSGIKEYRGYDIVPQLIEDNKKNFPGIHFEQKDIVIDGQFGKADILFCRDCLVHLSYASAKKVIQNFFYSDIKYFMATTFTNDDRANADFEDGTNWVPMNLMKAPFFLPEPLVIINEGYTGNDGDFADKSLAVWEKTDLINHISFT